MMSHLISSIVVPVPIIWLLKDVDKLVDEMFQS